MGIKTAGLERIKNLQERPLLWEQSAKKTVPEDVATPTVTTIKAQQGDEHVGHAEGQSDLSRDKGSAKDGDLQIAHGDNPGGEHPRTNLLDRECGLCVDRRD